MTQPRYPVTMRDGTIQYRTIRPIESRELRREGLSECERGHRISLRYRGHVCPVCGARMVK
jgi:hypothetical protein